MYAGEKGMYASSQCLAAGLLVAIILCQSLAVFPTMIFNSSRLKYCYKYVDLGFYHPAVRKCATYLVVVTVISIIIPVIYTLLAYLGAFNVASEEKITWFLVEIDLLLFLSEFVVTCFLSVSLLFLIVDINVCRLLVSELLQKATERNLTAAQFRNVRNEVARRCQQSWAVNSIIVIVAIMNTFGVILTIFYRHMGLSLKDGGVLMINTVFLKEIIFLVVLFLEVAQFNKEADDFSQQVADDDWGPLTISTNNDSSADASCISHSAEKQRISISIMCLHRPIFFELAGMRVTKRTLLYQSLALIASTCLALTMRFVIFPD
jgi:hypothetical protein